MKPALDIRKKLDLLLLLVVLPLAGVALAGKPVLRYLEFPPLTQYVTHPPFSWAAFIGLAVATVAFLTPFIVRVLRHQTQVPTSDACPSKPRARSASGRSRVRLPTSDFPPWGWLGVAITCGAWFLAWTRFAWFEPLQIFVFTPIWVGFVIGINALTYRRTGHCLLTDRPRYLIGLFIVSAGFWWYFEYLNRFVQNWYYVRIADLSRLQYFLCGTLPFSTVLPAVLSMNELLTSYPRLSAGLDRFARIDVRRPRLLAWFALVTSCAGLTAIGIWPDFLFPLLWLAPLVIIVSVQAIRGERTILSGLAKGDWRRIYLLALAALVCGFFWEFWNSRSFAKWIYNVPFVGRFKFFEMPVLGYAGYLPFGLECAVVAELLLRRRARHAATADAAVGTRPGLATVCKYGNAAIAIFIAGWFFIGPGLIFLRDLSDPALRGPEIPRIAWRLHRALTPRYARWARARVASGKAAHLHLYDVPSTEWPMFGSVYYLWATEALQKAWDQDNSLAPEPPRVYARATIVAAVDLIVDPIHHTWVKTHWGADYLHTENVFFRSLLIAGLTSYENLIGDGKHLALLRDQVETLAAELDASPHGVLEDYPDECYPIDVLSAVACIQRADKVLGTDHSAFVARAVRGFSGRMLDRRGLIPYLVDDRTGRLYGPSRGVGNSYVCIFAPELWPERARDWYKRYEQHFWQDKGWAAGFREYPRELEPEFAHYMRGRLFYDVDAGPIIAGFSPAANAFGVAAAKVNGRLDHAYTLATQVLASTWPLPNGSLLVPQLLSSRAHAPYLGETCLLFFFSRQPHASAALVTGGHKPGCVYIGMAIYFVPGLLIVVATLLALRRWRRRRGRIVVPHQTVQFAAWLAVLATALGLLALGFAGSTALTALVALCFPRGVRQRHTAEPHAAAEPSAQ